MYDVTIIGAGPAGISAALYAKRANLSVLVLYNGSSNVETAHLIENYYGFPGGISGQKLYEDGIEQAKKLGAEIKKVEVTGIIPSDNDNFVVKTVEGNFESKTIVLATGNKKVKPNIPGLKEFEGKGISYCAVCDAFFYRGKNVAVLGNGEFALSEAEELKNLVGNLTILTNGLEPVKTDYKVETKKIKELNGTEKIDRIVFEDGSEMQIDGIFVALGEAGADDFAKTMGILQDGENIRVNEKMETNVKGIYACGNVTGGLLQVCKAVYEGAVAGLSAVQYVREKNK